MKKKKPERKMLGPTLQEIELIPVTDPAEFEEMDRRCRAVEKAMAAARRKAGKRIPAKDDDSEVYRG